MYIGDNNIHVISPTALRKISPDGHGWWQNDVASQKSEANKVVSDIRWASQHKRQEHTSRVYHTCSTKKVICSNIIRIDWTWGCTMASLPSTAVGIISTRLPTVFCSIFWASSTVFVKCRRTTADIINGRRSGASCARNIGIAITISRTFIRTATRAGSLTRICS